MRNTAFAISRRFVAIELVCVADEQLGMFSLVSYLSTKDDAGVRFFDAKGSVPSF